MIASEKLPIQVLIYGARKSGSTLTHRLLDSSSLFCHPSETKIKAWFNPASIATMPDKFLYQADYFDYYGASELEYWKQVVKSRLQVKTLREYILAHVNLFKSVAKLEPSSANDFIIKEVGGPSKFIIDSFQALFPCGFVVCVLRSPLMVASAVFRQRRSVGIDLSLRQKINEAIDPWRVTSEILSRCESDERMLTVDYNSICANPANFVDTFRSFVGIDFDIIPEPTYNGILGQTKTTSRGTEKGVFSPRLNTYKGLTIVESLIIFTVAIFHLPVYCRYKIWCTAQS